MAGPQQQAYLQSHHHLRIASAGVSTGAATTGSTARSSGAPSCSWAGGALHVAACAVGATSSHTTSSGRVSRAAPASRAALAASSGGGCTQRAALHCCTSDPGRRQHRSAVPGHAGQDGSIRLGWQGLRRRRARAQQPGAALLASSLMAGPTGPPRGAVHAVAAWRRVPAAKQPVTHQQAMTTPGQRTSHHRVRQSQPDHGVATQWRWLQALLISGH
jgi:hypothetical protein